MLTWPNNDNVVIIPTDDKIMELYTVVLNHYGISPIHIKDIEPDFNINNYKSLKDAALIMHIKHSAAVIADKTIFSTVQPDDCQDRGLRKRIMCTDLLYIDPFSTMRHFRSSVLGTKPFEGNTEMSANIAYFISDTLTYMKYDDYSIAADTSVGISLLKLMKVLVDKFHVSSYKNTTGYCPLTTVINKMLASYQYGKHLNIELYPILNSEISASEADKYSRVDVVITTDLLHDLPHRYIMGTNGLAEYIRNNTMILGDLRPAPSETFNPNDYDGYTWRDYKDEYDTQHHDFDEYKMHYVPHSDSHSHDNPDDSGTYLDVMMHINSNPAIRRLLAYQLKRLGVAEVNTKSYTSSTMFDQLNK